MTVFDITQYAEGIPQESIRNEIANNSGRVIITYPMSHINSSQSYLDIMHNYLEASYIAEELGRYATSIAVEKILQYSHSPIYRYEIVVKEIEPFVEKLSQFSIVLADDQEDDDFLLEHQENLTIYAESLDDRLFLCPELIDGYYANLVDAGDHELDSGLNDGFLASEYKKYPEREYGFWKSAYSKIIGEDFYVSRECWVVPFSIDIEKLLTDYSGLSSSESYDEATLFSLDKVSYLANEYGVIYFPFSPLLHAQRFVTTVLRKSDTYEEIKEYLLTYFPEAGYVEEHYGFDLSSEIPPTKYLLSRSSLSIIVEEGKFRYVFFPEQVKGNNIAALYDQISTIFGFVGEFAGVTQSVNLSWENFDDEKFGHGSLMNLCTFTIE